MRWIDYEGKLPTDSDIPNWIPWSAERWNEWREKSRELLDKMSLLNADNKIDERNQMIDNHRTHWDELKPWLRALSLGKCWFTETKNEGCHEDVEHFRPKKVAKNFDGTERVGYWWLAFDYRNYRLVGTVPNRMKGGWFPLHKDSCCSTFIARCEQSETHALLDPTLQTDTALLAFNEAGEATASPGTSDLWDLDRVELSIRRYKLNDHDPLRQSRRAVWQETTREIESFLDAKLSYNPGINPSAKTQMESCAKAIRRMTRPNASFSSVALWCVKLRNDPLLLRLVSS